MRNASAAHRLDVALGRHRDDELLVVDEVLDVHVAGVVGELGAALGGELVADLGQLVLDDLAELGLVAEDRLELGDGLAQLGAISVSRSMRGQAGELAEVHVEDVLGLELAELEAARP